MKREELNASFDKIMPDEYAKSRMLDNILSHTGKEKTMARFNFRKVVPALTMVVVMAVSILFYKTSPLFQRENANTSQPGLAEPGLVTDSDAREDMAAPLLNEFTFNNRHYYLMSDEMRSEFGFPARIDENDIGEKLATITKAADQSLIGREVYGYKPAGCEAVVAVKKDDSYLLFQFLSFESYNNNQDEDAIEYLKLYGINKAEDIAKIQFIVYSEQSKLEGRLDISGEITDLNDITRFYNFYSVLKNSSDKYFELLFNQRPGVVSGRDVEVDIQAPDVAPPPETAPDAVDPVKYVPPILPEAQTAETADDMPLKREEYSSGDTPVSSDSGMVDMGDTVPNTGVGQVAPSQGAGTDALDNPVGIRIYNQSGVFFDTYYYRNIGFISRYEISQEFADFLRNYIK